MKRRVENWSVSKLYQERAVIGFPEFQRQAHLWSKEKKALLIDSILRDIDIPKLYFSKNERGEYDVIDGQQRLWAIWDFLEGTFGCLMSGASRKFSDLAVGDQKALKNYTFQVVVIEEASEEYLRDLFLRLQLGLLLLSGEKLHAKTGAIRDFIFGVLPIKPFMSSLGLSDRRYSKETLCAQICINAFSRAKSKTFARTRYEDLQYFFDEYKAPHGKDKEFFDAQKNRIDRLFDDLGECFGEQATKLRNRAYILSVYLLFEELMERSMLPELADRKDFAKFAVSFWDGVKSESHKSFDSTNRELYEFGALVSSAPGERYQIERRHERLLQHYDGYRKGESAR